MSESTGPVTKLEALQFVTNQIEHAKVLDVNTLIELMTWQSKLAYWLIKECAANNFQSRP